jgi:hypothetical protein
MNRAHAMRPYDASAHFSAFSSFLLSPYLLSLFLLSLFLCRLEPGA